MWDEPSAEVTQLKKQCEMMLENYEEDIESWYFSNQGKFESQSTAKKPFLVTFGFFPTI